MPRPAAGSSVRVGSPWEGLGLGMMGPWKSQVRSLLSAKGACGAVQPWTSTPALVTPGNQEPLTLVFFPKVPLLFGSGCCIWEVTDYEQISLWDTELGSRKGWIQGKLYSLFASSL